MPRNSHQYYSQPTPPLQPNEIVSPVHLQRRVRCYDCGIAFLQHEVHVCAPSIQHAVPTPPSTSPPTVPAPPPLPVSPKPMEKIANNALTPVVLTNRGANKASQSPPKEINHEGICPYIDLKDVEVVHKITKRRRKLQSGYLLEADTASTATWILRDFVKPLLHSGHATYIRRNLQMTVMTLRNGEQAITTDLVSLCLAHDRAVLHIHALIIDEIVEAPQLCPHSIEKLRRYQNLYNPYGIAKFNNNFAWASMCPNNTVKIAILVGQPGVWDIILESKRIPTSLLFNILTPFGILTSGTLSSFCNCPATTNSFVADHRSLLTQSERLSACLEQIFREESLAHDEELVLTTDELAAYHYIKENTIYDPVNKYFTTRLLWRPQADGTPGPPLMNSTYSIAVKRFHTMERQLRSRPPLYTELVVKSVVEHINNGSYKLIPPKEVAWYTDPNNQKTHTLAFRLVFRDGHESTPCRATFDASQTIPTMKTSINDLLYTGPSNLHSMYLLQLKWRSGRVAFVCDISRMFLSIRVHRQDQNYQTFVWRTPNTDEPLRLYRSERVIFGLRSSPFVASYMLNTLAKMVRDNPKYSKDMHKAADLILNSIYMDDILGFASSVQEARILIQGIESILALGNFKAAKYAATDGRALTSLPIEKLAKQGVSKQGVTVKYDEDRTLLEHPAGFRTLGQLYSVPGDSFVFGGYSSLMKEMLLHEQLTKRHCASTVARMQFDLIGLKAGVSLRLRIILRNVMIADKKAERPINKQNWDRPLDPPFAKAFVEFLKDLPMLDKVHLKRYLNFEGEFEIHGYCDASNDGISACLYLRRPIPNSNKYDVSFILGKANVRSLATMHDSIPRAELQGCVLLTRLFATLLHAHDMNLTRCYAWTDSSAVYYWLRQSLGFLTPYVSNRVKVVRDFKLNQWSYVRSAHNAADRGAKSMAPSDLANSNHNIWKDGPKYLQLPRDKWPDFNLQPNKKDDEFLSGIRKSTIIQTFKIKATKIRSFAPYDDVTNKLFTSSNDYPKIVSRVATFMCFFHYLRYKVFQRRNQSPNRVFEIHVENIPSIPTLAAQLYRARLALLSYIQQKHYLDEMYALADEEQIDSHSKILAHCPYLDNIENVFLLRSYTRLAEAKNTSTWCKYPIILPSFKSNDKTSRVRCIAEHIHMTMFHCTVGGLWRALTNSGLLITPRAKQCLQNVTSQCTKCDKAHTRHRVPAIMAPLPSDRSSPESFRPWESLSLDNFGPLSVKSSIFAKSDVTTRQKKAHEHDKRCYALILSCTVTRAINVVLLPSLSLHDFLNGIMQHAGKFGWARQIRSDNFSSFKAGDRVLADLFKRNQKELLEFATSHSFRWLFGTPNRPESHGEIEAQVAIIKRLCKEHLNLANPLTFTECQANLDLASLVANLRPLAATYDADNDVIRSICPFSLCFGYEPQFIQLSNLDDYVTPDLKGQWKARMAAQKSFILAYKNNYLQSLAKRQKWHTAESRQLKVGSICLLDNSEALTKRKYWPLVRITALLPARDGQLRKVQVSVADAEYVHTKQTSKKKSPLKGSTIREVSVHQLRLLKSFEAAESTTFTTQTDQQTDFDDTSCAKVKLATMLSNAIIHPKPNPHH